MHYKFLGLVQTHPLKGKGNMVQCIINPLSPLAITLPYTSMGKPCDVCGHTGYEGCIIVCCRCKINREHPYCMKKVHEGDPGDWICEECESGVQIPSLIPAANKQPSDKTKRSNIRKPPRSTKVQYISPEEAMGLESGAQKKFLSSPSKSKISSRPTVKRTCVPNMESNKCSVAPPKVSVKPYLHDEPPPGFAKRQCTRSIPNTLLDKKLSASKDTEKHVVQKQLDQPDSTLVITVPVSKAQTPNATAEERNKGPARHLNKDNSSGLTSRFEKNAISNTGIPNANLESASVQSIEQHLPSVRSGVSVPIDSQQENVGSGTKQSLGVALELDKFLPNHPAFPTWKGMINITSNDDVLPYRSFDGIQAHPPCKVHRKAHEFSKLMPTALQFELLPRLNFWKDLFEDDIPDALDIGLYFLSPESCSSEQNLISLLEVVHKHDMLLRSKIDGVELLIFSSRHLPEGSQRINKKFFLWGLFRASEDNITVLKATDNAMELRDESGDDMDIDMSGGQEFDNIDKVVGKLAEKACVAGRTVAEPTENATLGSTVPESTETVSLGPTVPGYIPILQEVGTVDKVVGKLAQKASVAGHTVATVDMVVGKLAQKTSVAGCTVAKPAENTSDSDTVPKSSVAGRTVARPTVNATVGPAVPKSTETASVDPTVPGYATILQEVGAVDKVVEKLAQKASVAGRTVAKPAENTSAGHTVPESSVDPTTHGHTPILQEVGIIDKVVGKLAEKASVACRTVTEPAETASISPAVPKSTENACVSPTVPGNTSILQDPLEFERDLQKMLDRLLMLRKPDGVKVKEEVGSPR